MPGSSLPIIENGRKDTLALQITPIYYFYTFDSYLEY